MIRDNHILEEPMIARPPGSTFGQMYRMHRYWSKKAPDIIEACIRKNSREEGIVLDPFCGSGITAIEAVRLGRKAVAIDLNPMATFIARTTLSPVNLSRLRMAFQDMKALCEEPVNELYITKCHKCGGESIIDFVIRENEHPIKIAYSCRCSKSRMFKEPDSRDLKRELAISKKRIPYWYPVKYRLPIIQRENFRYLHELFTRRNLIALSRIFNAVGKIEDPIVSDIMKMTFSASLDKSSRLKPIGGLKKGSRPSLSESWVAVRFYAPKISQEVNPWLAFKNSFDRVYAGKKESNERLQKVIIGSKFEELVSNNANVIIFNGSAEEILDKSIPNRSIDYMLTDPPFGGSVQFLSLSSFWGAWLKENFDYDQELTINRFRSISQDHYSKLLGKIFKSARKVMKSNSNADVFCHDVRGPYLHKMLNALAQAKFAPKRVLHQPPPSSFSTRVKQGRGNFDSYIIQSKAVRAIKSPKNSKAEIVLRNKISEVVKKAIKIRGGISPLATIYYAIYQSLGTEEILLFAQKPADQFIKDCIAGFADLENAQLIARRRSKTGKLDRRLTDKISKALLDAKSLYVNNSKGEAKKNQIYQRVLSRFKGSYITIDEIRAIDHDIHVTEIQECRNRRLAMLLRRFGKILGFDSQTVSGQRYKIRWEIKKNVRVTFEVTDKNTLVSANRLIGRKYSVSEVGLISDEDLECALLNWCQNNPHLSSEIKDYLNPSCEESPRIEHPKHYIFKVLDNKEVCRLHYLLTLEIPKHEELNPLPGQFFHIICDPLGSRTMTQERVARGYSLTLRRPFSVHRVYYPEFDRRILATPTVIADEIKRVIKRRISKIEILYKVVGKGTKDLSRVRPGQNLDMIGPLGNGFKECSGTAVIAAGGIGVAPLVLLAERLRYFGNKVYLYFGALNKELLRPIIHPDSTIERSFGDGSTEFLDIVKNEFMAIGAENVIITTDDGSIGKKGLISDAIECDINSGFLPKDDITVYACGPSKMLEAVSRVSKQHRIPCQVLLEERMACGIGACFSCTCYIQTKGGNIERKRVCVDGPVFNSQDVVWRD